MSFDPKQLRGFVAVAEAGSIGLAAKAVNITQPALSRTIRNMEARHGVRLFERTATGVTLSQAGEAFLPRARMLLFELEGAADELRAFRGLRKGEVRVGAVSAVVRTILAPSVARLHAANPHLHIKIIESHDDLLFSALIGYEIDLVISANTHQSEDVSTIDECLFEDSYNIFCRSNHPALSKDPHIDELLPGKWIMPSPHSTPRKLFEKIVQRHGYARPNVVVETSSPSTMIACATHSDLTGWLPDPVFEGAILAGFVRRIEIKEFRLARRFFLFRRSKGILAPAATALIDALPLKRAKVALPTGSPDPRGVDDDNVKT